MKRIYQMIKDARRYRLSLGFGDSCVVHGSYNTVTLETVAGNPTLCFSKDVPFKFGSAVPDDVFLTFSDQETLISTVSDIKNLRVDIRKGALVYTIYCDF